jgi:hypothetical protein
MTDIVKRLKEGIHDLDYNTHLDPLLNDAADEIVRLRKALRRIGFDYVELSHEKVQWLYLEHIKIAKEAWLESNFGEDEEC